MDIEKLRNYCLKKKGVTEEFPFGEDTLVFKVMGKMFCLTGMNPPFYCNLKCDPEVAIELREKYEGVTPGYHMNKKHWNSVYFDTNIPDNEILEWVDQSYNLVVESLPKKIKDELYKM